jgi:transposase-like protein
MRRIFDAFADSLIPFIENSIEPASTVHTDGCLGYLPLEGKEHRHEIKYLKGNSKIASELMPRVHRAALLKRWLLGTHQGGVSTEHLDAYLDEFTFRFNRRKSRSRGKPFYRF